MVVPAWNVVIELDGNRFHKTPEGHEKDRRKTAALTDAGWSVDAYCFDGDELLSEDGDYAEQDGPVDANGQVTFTASLYGASCPTFAVGIGGYFAE
jgi:hypothetical protein